MVSVVLLARKRTPGSRSMERDDFDDQDVALAQAHTSSIEIDPEGGLRALYMTTESGEEKQFLKPGLLVKHIRRLEETAAHNVSQKISTEHKKPPAASNMGAAEQRIGSRTIASTLPAHARHHSSAAAAHMSGTSSHAAVTKVSQPLQSRRATSGLGVVDSPAETLLERPAKLAAVAAISRLARKAGASSSSHSVSTTVVRGKRQAAATHAGVATPAAAADDSTAAASQDAAVCSSGQGSVPAAGQSVGGGGDGGDAGGGKAPHLEVDRASPPSPCAPGGSPSDASPTPQAAAGTSRPAMPDDPVLLCNSNEQQQPAANLQQQPTAVPVSTPSTTAAADGDGAVAADGAAGETTSDALGGDSPLPSAHTVSWYSNDVARSPGATPASVTQQRAHAAATDPAVSAGDVDDAAAGMRADGGGAATAEAAGASQGARDFSRAVPEAAQALAAAMARDAATANAAAEAGSPAQVQAAVDSAAGYEAAADSAAGYEAAADSAAGYEAAADSAAGYEAAADSAAGYEAAVDSAAGYEAAVDSAAGYEAAVDSASGYEAAADSAAGHEAAVDSAATEAAWAALVAAQQDTAANAIAAAEEYEVLAARRHEFDCDVCIGRLGQLRMDGKVLRAYGEKMEIDNKFIDKLAGVRGKIAAAAAEVEALERGCQEQQQLLQAQATAAGHSLDWLIKEGTTAGLAVGEPPESLVDSRNSLRVNEFATPEFGLKAGMLEDRVGCAQCPLLQQKVEEASKHLTVVEEANACCLPARERLLEHRRELSMLNNQVAQRKLRLQYLGQLQLMLEQQLTEPGQQQAAELEAAEDGDLQPNSGDVLLDVPGLQQRTLLLESDLAAKTLQLQQGEALAAKELQQQRAALAAKELQLQQQGEALAAKELQLQQQGEALAAKELQQQGEALADKERNSLAQEQRLQGAAMALEEYNAIQASQAQRLNAIMAAVKPEPR